MRTFVSILSGLALLVGCELVTILGSQRLIFPLPGAGRNGTRITIYIAPLADTHWTPAQPVPAWVACTGQCG